MCCDAGEAQGTIMSSVTAIVASQKQCDAASQSRKAQHIRNRANTGVSGEERAILYPKYACVVTQR